MFRTGNFARHDERRRASTLFRIGEIIDLVLAYHPEADAELIERAYISWYLASSI